MTSDGIKCTLTIKLPEEYISNADQFSVEHVVFTHDILIKPRPEKEQALLDKWLQDVPKQFLPPVVKVPFVDDNKHWYTPEMDAFERDGYRKSDGNYIEINGKKYNPWCFIRDGNRKPPAQICPTTLEGWKELENSLVPSTMRDEIQLTRMLIDYLGAKGEAQVQKREALVQWLKSLPEPQRMSMVSSLEDIYSTQGMYHASEYDPGRATDLAKPYFDLLVVLQPMMSYYHKNSLQKHIKP